MVSWSKENAKQDALVSRLDTITSYDASNQMQAGKRITGKETLTVTLKIFFPRSVYFSKKANI